MDLFTIQDMRLMNDIENLQFSEVQRLSTKVFKIPPALRTMKFLQILERVVQDVAFFHKLAQDSGRQTFFQCLRFLQMETFKQNQIVCKKGDNGTNFYIVLSGGVQIYVTTSEQIPKKQKHLDLLVQQAIQGMICVARLGPGQSFGELALIKKIPRMATVITDCVCEMATLSKHDYQSVLLARQVEILEEKRQELRVAFKNINNPGINQLVYLISPRVYSYRTYVISQGQKFEQDPVLFLIRSGEFKILKSENHYKVKTEMLKSLDRSSLKFLCLLSTGELFGEMEVFQQLDRQFSVQCVSEIGEVYAIRYQELVKILDLTSNLRTLDQLRKQTELKYDRLTQQNVTLVTQESQNNQTTNMSHGYKSQKNINEQSSNLKKSNRLMSLKRMDRNQQNQNYDTVQAKEQIFDRLNANRSQSPIIKTNRPLSSVMRATTTEISVQHYNYRSIIQSRIIDEYEEKDKNNKNKTPDVPSNRRINQTMHTCSSVIQSQERNPAQEIKLQLKKIFSFKTKKQVKKCHYKSYSFMK